MASAKLVDMPRIALTHIQNKAPGPPMSKAMATPTMLPVPTCEAMAVERACIGLIPADAVAFSLSRGRFRMFAPCAEVIAGHELQPDSEVDSGTQQYKHQYRSDNVAVQLLDEAIDCILIHSMVFISAPLRFRFPIVIF